MKNPPQNIERMNLTRLLRKKSRESEVNIWKRVAELLEKPKRRRFSVNLSKINRYTKKDDVVVVPGKTLSTGILDHTVTVASFSFSKNAREKIERTGGKCLKIEELITQNPKGSNVKIIV